MTTIRITAAEMFRRVQSGERESIVSADPRTTEELERAARDAWIAHDHGAQKAAVEELARRELLNAPAPAPAADPRDRYFTHGCGADVLKTDAEVIPAPVVLKVPGLSEPRTIPIPANFTEQVKVLRGAVRERVWSGKTVQLRGGDRWYVVSAVEPDFGWDAIRGRIVDHTEVEVVPVKADDEREPFRVHISHVKPQA